MVSRDFVEKELKKIKFDRHGWGRGEVSELHNILLPDEEIYECVNGMYENGFALLVATSIRVLLVDKKPLNFLSVEDFRFDMISEIDYSHRLMGAHISVSTGSKNLQFTSINQPRLRKLITHVQHCMAAQKQKQSEHQEDQKQHLEEINKQLQAYLQAQHEQQETLRREFEQAKAQGTPLPSQPQPIRPSNELADYLFTQSLLQQYRDQTGQPLPVGAPPLAPVAQQLTNTPIHGDRNNPNLEDLYSEGYREVFGAAQPAVQLATQAASESSIARTVPALPVPAAANLEVNPLRIAYSRLPMALRNRKFGRPSFHAHSQAPVRPRVAEI
ncbi:MAG TPA: PH domain-containing protein [Candidatus Saccharimonadales bacterium]|nr:PH domain-containing protein [Candidatus Saccharimonadales bacterium]